MRPRERLDTREQDLFRSRLDRIIDMDHALAKLARIIDWRFLEERFGAVYTDGPGSPPLPTRLMAGLAILKHMHDLSDEVLCERWVENPYYQYLCGEEFFQHRLVFDRSSLTRWRQRMGEEKLQALVQESLSVATRTKAIKPSDLSRVIVDTTVQPKNVMFPTDAKLLNRAREIRDPSAAGQEARRGATPVLQAGWQVRADQASALRPRQTVQPCEQILEEAQNLPGPGDPRHLPQDQGQQGPGKDICLDAVAGPAGVRAEAASARPKDLQPARAGGRMHRQGQGPSAL
jgi:hypothetical protein